MNCTSRVVPHLRERAARAALWTARDGVVTFAQLGRMAAGVQARARAEGLRPGVPVLLLDSPGPRLFAAVTGLLALGVPVLFVEPWLPVADVEHVIGLARPQAFVGGTLAMLWAARVRAVRRTPRWLHIGRVARERGAAPFHVEDVDRAAPAVITFTSGTTGAPKGIERSHGYMWDVHEILTEGGTRDAFDGPDLCVFPNVALLHLATGRGAVLVPPAWDDRALQAIAALPPALQPQSLTCGPAFLQRLLYAAARPPLAALRSVTVGGALSDCAIVQMAIERWPDAEWTHVYGGTEAEPVSHADARESVRLSWARGLHQMLHVGRPIPQLATRSAPEGLWVSGPNVAPPYGGSGARAADKRVDDGGRLWHCMGDRIDCDADGWWFAGRATQPRADFDLEQRIYSYLASSACFVHRARDGRAILCTDPSLARLIVEASTPVTRDFPEIAELRPVPIVRDRRHRARIDRRASLAKARLADV